MSQKQHSEDWATKGFTAVEWDLVLTTWANIASNNQVVFGPKAPVEKNMKALLAGMSKSDKTIAKLLKQGLPSRSRKYKRLYSYVGRMSKGQAEDNEQTSEEENQLQFDSNSSSLRL